MLCQICRKGHCFPFKNITSLFHAQKSTCQICPLKYCISKNAYSSNEKTKKSEWVEPRGFESGVNVWNSLTKKVSPLILKNENQLSWYMCGPTVYDSAHIGHASSYMRFDIMRRILENYFNIDVHLVMGLTDIDDKIINKANKVEKPFTEVAKKYEVEFLQDMDKLNISPPSFITRVSDHIPQIIQYIQTIQKKGLAYPTDDGSLYFDVLKYGRYGSFRSHATDEDYKGFKKHASDFALWKGVKPDEPFWESPWGKGRPGWHIECSAMASEIFGSNFDVHSGGEDLKFPHHENEIAQSQAHYGCHQWVNYWIHTGYLHLKGDENKMSKSLNNVVGISEFLGHYSADQLRMMCLQTSYRHYLEYSEDVMTRASTNLNQILNCLNLCEIYVKGQLHCKAIDEVQLQKSINECRISFKKYLANDFDTGQAFIVIYDLVKFLNSSLSKIEKKEDHIRCPATVAAASIFIKSTLTKLGFDLENQMSSSKGGDMLLLNKAMDNLVDLRLTVRKFCIDPPSELFTEPLEDKKLEKKRRKEVFSPLLKKCDTVRDDLKTVDISVKDLGNDSSWLIEKK